MIRAALSSEDDTESPSFPVDPLLGLPEELRGKIAVLQEHLRGHAPLLVAFSGGVDSACLLALAHRTLGESALGVIADSASLPRQALAEAVTLAESLGARLEVVPTKEMENPEYASNPLNRCYFCKAELFVNMERIAAERAFAGLAYGENADDPAHLRPGSQAAKEFAVLAPLRFAGLTKAEIREISRALGLPTADAPAQPCLASRIPHGTRVTREALGMVERAEAFVRGMGFRVFRVRHLVVSEGEQGELRARLQILPEEMPRLEEPQMREMLERGIIAAGYLSLEIDPKGYTPSH